MRSNLTVEKLRRFMEEVGLTASGPGTVYLTGGATALLLGFREQTIDVDIKLDPEPPGIFQALAAIKVRFALNVELASPDQFIPAIPGWRERSVHIETYGGVGFYHYDFYGQALAKILRGHVHDLADARDLVDRGLIRLDRLTECIEQIEPELIRYPAIDPAAFRERVEAFVGGSDAA